MIEYPAGFNQPRGAIMFAHNNPSIDYGTLALCNALLIKKNLKRLPVALISDSGTISHLEKNYSDNVMRKAFDRIILDENTDSSIGQRRFNDTRYTVFTEGYKNTNRTNAYNLSPFDETLMVDVDYLMLDNTMNLVWNNTEDFMCNRKTIDLNHAVNAFGFDNRFNEMSIPLYWATAVYFRKTEKSRLIFELMNFIKENYAYYQYLYRFNHSGYFRNDYALSIAIHMTNNLMEYGSVSPLPVNHILFSMEHDELHQFKDGNCMITSEPVQGEFRMHSVSSNVHMMNKRAILRSKDEIIEYAIG
jgi:hypothetical protein